MPPRIGTGTAACFLVGWWGLRWLERRLCGAVVAAVPRKRSGNRRCVSWSKGTGCGGAASFSFGEKPGSNGGSAGRWLLPFPGNGPGTGGVFLGWREQAAAGRRASLSGRGRLGQKFPRGSGCCRSSETVREQAVCFLVEGDGLRRGGEPLFRGEAGSDTFPVATAIRCYRPLLAFPLLAACLPAACHHLIIRCCLHPPPLLTRRTSCQPPRRLPPPAACHYPPPATSATVACHPCRCLPSRCCRLPPACHYPPPATSAADCVLTACVSTVCRFSPLVITTCRPPLPPAACLLPPSPACHHPLLPAPPPLLTRRYRPPQQLPATPATLRNLPPPAACHFRRHAPAGRTDGLRRHPAWSVGARCVAGEKFCEIIWKIGKSFLSLFRLSIGVLAFRGRDSCFLLDYHSYGKRDYLSDGGRVQEAQGRA